ncbi:MAG: tyrosine-type recombinase/integrase [Hyphomonadaceae bacterium]
MSRHAFPELVHRFFAEYLLSQRNLSINTIAAYRDTFRLLLRFLAVHLKQPIDALSLDSLTPETVLAFLSHLEETRKNSPRTRNYRLAAICAFTRFVLSQADPDVFVAGHRILAIPVKRSARPMMGFLSREEVEAILAAVDLSRLSGARDHLLFTLLYNTGARISEALAVTPADIRGRVVRLRGKGRKERAVPLWSRTAGEIGRWCRTQGIGQNDRVFTNARGEPLSRQGARFRLHQAVTTARQSCSSLVGRKIGLHSLRHTCAMHLLQSGVALEVIALWLGHERPVTTHGYVEADLKMKEACLDRLKQPPRRRPRRSEGSRLLSFLETI